MALKLFEILDIHINCSFLKYRIHCCLDGHPPECYYETVGGIRFVFMLHTVIGIIMIYKIIYYSRVNSLSLCYASPLTVLS